jgi:uncharacterized membrane-anchored protein
MFLRSLGVFILTLAMYPGPSLAQSDAIRSEFAAALRDAQTSQILGPNEVKLLDQAALQLPQDYSFVPVPAAARLLKAMGNTPDPHLVGVIFPGHQDNWMMAIQFEKSGHIKDDDARDWNVDDLLKRVSESTERGDIERRKEGFPEIEVLGWAQKPRYDATTHRLVWAIVARDKASAPGSEQGVNYNTYALGRDGYFKLNLVTDLKDLASQKGAADAILDSLQYSDGKKYSDFNPSVDKAADFSVMALVAGIAANKLGLLAVLGEAAIEYLKYIITGGVIVLLILGWAIFRKVALRSADTGVTYDDFPPTIVSNPAMEESTLTMPTIPQSNWAAAAARDGGHAMGPLAPLSPGGSGSPVASPGFPAPSRIVEPALSSSRPAPAPEPVAGGSESVAGVSARATLVSTVSALTTPAAKTGESIERTAFAGDSTSSGEAGAAVQVVGERAGRSMDPAGVQSSFTPSTPVSSAPVSGEPSREPPQPVVVPNATPVEPAATAEPATSVSETIDTSVESGAEMEDAEEIAAPLIPESPSFVPVTAEEAPDVFEPEMVFTPRAPLHPAHSIPALGSEPMLIFGAAPQPAAVPSLVREGLAVDPVAPAKEAPVGAPALESEPKQAEEIPKISRE